MTVLFDTRSFLVKIQFISLLRKADNRKVALVIQQKNGM